MTRYARSTKNGNVIFSKIQTYGQRVSQYLNYERQNLNREVSGVIIAFADLGLWLENKEKGRQYN